MTKMFKIGQKVFHSAQQATVVAIDAGKRGRTLLTIETPTRTIKVDARSIETPIEFAPACTIQEFFAPLPSSAQALRAKINR